MIVIPDPASITLDVYEKSIGAGKYFTLKATVEPAEADQKITWTSSNPEIAKVNSKGRVTGVSLGTATITATTVNGISAECEVEVLFTDVANPGKFYFEPVYWAYYHKPQVTTGTSPTTFSPNDTVTRIQIVTFLYRFKSEPEVTGEMPFTDVKANAYYANAVLWVYQNDVTTGTSETTFDPKDTCTRGQAVTFLYRAAQLK